jgi:NhaP-type Na+/H+ and K+/H+ antiporter
MKFLIILILTITITGETMSHVKGHNDFIGPQYKNIEKSKKLKVDITEPEYTEKVNKKIQIGGIEIGGIYRKKPNFSKLRKLFKKNKW